MNGEEKSMNECQHDWERINDPGATTHRRFRCTKCQAYGYKKRIVGPWLKRNAPVIAYRCRHKGCTNPGVKKGWLGTCESFFCAEHNVSEGKG